MKYTRTSKAGTPETVEVSRIVRMPAEAGSSKKFVVSRTEVVQDLGTGTDRIIVESEGKPAGELRVRAGLGETISKWLLSDARTVGVE